MDVIQKFFSDIEKIKKHNRDSSGKLNMSAVVSQIENLFETNNRGFCDLPHTLVEYWEKKYVNAELDGGAEDLSRECVDKLCAMQAFLNNDDETDCLTDEDWREMADAVNYEAEDLDRDILSQMMSTLVEKQAL